MNVVTCEYPFFRQNSSNSLVTTSDSENVFAVEPSVFLRKRGLPLHNGNLGKDIGQTLRSDSMKEIHRSAFQTP